MFEIIQEIIDDRVSDAELEAAEKDYPHCTPKTKEALYYRYFYFFPFFFFDIFNYFCSKNIAKLFNFIVIFAGKYLNLIIQVEVNRLLPIFGCHDG